MEDPASLLATGSSSAQQGYSDGANEQGGVVHEPLCGGVEEEELCSKPSFLAATSGDPFQDGDEDGRSGEFLLSKKADEWARCSGDALANLVFELRADDELFGGAERLLCVRDLFEAKDEAEAKPDEAAGGIAVHGVSEPSRVRRFPCTLEGCDRVFDRGRHLRVHLLSHATSRPFKCPVDGCVWAFATEYKLKRHLETHEGKKDFKCDAEGCGQSFTTVYNLRAHLKLHGRPTFACLSPGCPRLFGTRRKMELHLREHKELDAPYRCPWSGCGKAYYSANTLASHVRVHQHRPEELCCPFPGCGRSFARACKLRLHVRQHTGERPYACPACSWTFASASKLTRHMRKHTGDRRYACPEAGCGKAFMRPEHLRGHLVVHSGGRPFACTQPGCQSRFAAKSSLYIHLKKHGPAGEQQQQRLVYGCPMGSCTSRFHSRLALREHIGHSHAVVVLEDDAQQGIGGAGEEASPEVVPPRLVKENQSGSARTDFASHHRKRSCSLLPAPPPASQGPLPLVTFGGNSGPVWGGCAARDRPSGAQRERPLRDSVRCVRYCSSGPASAVWTSSYSSSPAWVLDPPLLEPVQGSNDL
ncbi:uncharacterized protein LOC144094203 isoform X2 [Amblyomma americanum]